jgi:ABC-2 type transport system permease protein
MRDRGALVVLLAMPSVLLVFMNQIFESVINSSGGDEVTDFMSIERVTVAMTVFGILWMLTVAAGKIAGDKETGYLRRLRTTPTRALGFVLAYSTAPFFVCIFQILLVFGVSVILGLRWQENTYLVFIIYLLCSLSTIGLAMILSSFTSNREQIEGITIFILLPLAFFSGAFMPSEIMPAWARIIGDYTYTGIAIKTGGDVLVDNVNLTTVVPELTYLCIWTVSLFILGVLFFRRNI